MSSESGHFGPLSHSGGAVEERRDRARSFLLAVLEQRDIDERLERAARSFRSPQPTHDTNSYEDNERKRPPHIQEDVLERRVARTSKEITRVKAPLSYRNYKEHAPREDIERRAKRAELLEKELKTAEKQLEEMRTPAWRVKILRSLMDDLEEKYRGVLNRGVSDSEEGSERWVQIVTMYGAARERLNIPADSDSDSFWNYRLNEWDSRLKELADLNRERAAKASGA